MYFFERPEFIKPLDSLRLVMKNQARGVRFGESRSKYFGSGVEVSHLKNYSAGEDVKFIDWNASFRLNRTFTRVFCETRENNVYILIDSSKSMNFGVPESKRFLALKLAYCIAYLSAAGFNKIYAADFCNKIRNASEINRANINIKFREFVDRAAEASQSAASTHIACAFNSFIANFKRRGLLFVISDFLDSGVSVMDSIAKAAIAQKLCFIQTLCEEELKIPDTGEYFFEDSETFETVELSLTPEAAAEYDRRVEEFCTAVAQKTLKYGGYYKKVITGSDYMPALKDILLKTGFNGGV